MTTEEAKPLTNREKNALFEALTPSQKRVAIAKDVLMWMGAKKLEVDTGRWLDSSGGTLECLGVSGNKPLDEHLAERETCTGCALGVLFYATVMRADKLTVGDLRKKVPFDLDREDLILRGAPAFMGYLEQYFDRDQLELIESAFEGSEGYFSNPDDESGRFDSFQEVGDEERVTMIMNNIIRNDGEFVA